MKFDLDTAKSIADSIIKNSDNLNSMSFPLTECPKCGASYIKELGHNCTNVIDLDFHDVSKEKGTKPNGRLVFKFKTKVYEITYDKFTIEDCDLCSCAEHIIVKEDGVPTENFGASFIGSFNSNDVLAAVIQGYLNNDLALEFIEIPDEVKMLKDRFYTSVMVVKDREVPKYYYTEDLTAVPLILVTETTSAYSDGEYMVLVDNENGAVLTDMEPFFSSGLAEISAEPILFEEGFRP